MKKEMQSITSTPEMRMTPLNEDLKVKVKLTQQEMMVGCTTGMTRHIESVANNRQPRFPEKYTGQLLLSHQLGACAELAYCKIFNIFYSPTVNTFHVADIGDDVEVRYSNLNYLKVRKDDNNIYCVSMCGNLQYFRYNGWIWSEDAKKDEWIKDFGGHGKPAYFVPTENLNKGEIERT